MFLLRVAKQRRYGRFLGFETLTLVPFERDAILVEELEEQEREWLNVYHARVMNEIGKYLNEEEYKWLKEVTSEL